MGTKVRMSDIAKTVGVSTVTVSRALAGKEGVGDAMRERILRTAMDMGYHPKISAKPSANTQHFTYRSGIQQMPTAACTSDAAAPITGGLGAFSHQQAAPGIYRRIACHYHCYQHPIKGLNVIRFGGILNMR